jgi:threonine dehydratase
MQTIPNFENIKSAYELIKNQVKQTPVLTSQSVNNILGCELFFKCENFQKVGAFKFRGASNAVLSLIDEQAARGVATHSSGNHAQALALAARMRGIPAYIVMPDNSPKVKSDAVAGYGGQIIFCEPTLQAREKTLEKVVSDTGAEFIHPYNNFNVICGQGTAALELLREIPNLEIVMTPVGGGGLLSGTSISVKSINPNIKVIAGEPKGADDAFQSLQKGEIVPSVMPKTIADGLLTSLGTLTFEIIRKNVDEIITVSEESIIKGMRLIWERMKIIIEPSSAVTIAAIIENPEKFSGKKIGIIISGGNVDLGKLPF